LALRGWEWGEAGEKMHSEELHNLWVGASPNIIRAIKSRRTRQVDHVARKEI